MKMFTRLLLIGLSAIMLYGCPTTPTKDAGAAVEDRGTAAGTGAETGTADGSNVSGDPFSDPANPLSKRVVYFDLDSSEVQQDDRPAISAHAKHLADNAGEVVTLEGHADERGSREYNLALGEQRSNAVRQLLLAEGASAQQIQVVSYGEEKPADDGHDEGAWQLNRRVEFVYTSR